LIAFKRVLEKPLFFGSGKWFNLLRDLNHTKQGGFLY
jgi:hypothetical protein